MPRPVETTVATPLLDVAHAASGPAGLTPVLLLHGWPDAAMTWGAVVPLLHDAGYPTIVPHLRGFGPTRFRSADTMRSGQYTAIAQDTVDLLDALGIDKVILAGHDWGARAGYAVAALWPERVERLVAMSVGYDGNRDPAKLQPVQQDQYWYQWFFHTARAPAMLKEHRRPFCHQLWQRWAPGYPLGDAEFAETAKAWDNPDWVDVTIHSYRHRWRAAANDPRYDALETKMDEGPKIKVPTTVLHGEDDGASRVESSAGLDAHFAGPYTRRVLTECGHFVPRERPLAVADAILDRTR